MDEVSLLEIAEEKRMGIVRVRVPDNEDLKSMESGVGFLRR